MNPRTAASWQTSLADLSLILFMITAAAVTHRPAHQRPSDRPAPTHRQVAPSDRSEPTAVYIDAPGAPPLDRWLGEQPRDPRQQLTITVAYAPGRQADALEAAARLLRSGPPDPALEHARIVVEPGDGPLRAVLAFDAPPAPFQAPSESVARSLRPSGQASTHGPLPR
ncbi:hypothetical protein EDF56_104417 [Novosphingobium sp. PhB165]|uniref:hypothetical protein n=1 Tax=Novosphingobium sp. PhB165 TaxID=2485105 RepID=UPI0010EAF8E9|nr:hypothetical protein [Novosphingobium sp. PhB165]TCM18883.1 hypothetical protein EDF56_104417 [Novosphingobium sp. PhB165]